MDESLTEGFKFRGIFDPHFKSPVNRRKINSSPNGTKKPTDAEVKNSANKHPEKDPNFPSSSKPKPQAAARNSNPNSNSAPSSPAPPPTPIPTTRKTKSQPPTPSPALPPTPSPTRKTKCQPTMPSSSSKINVVRRIYNDNSPKASPKISPTSGSDCHEKAVKTTAYPNSPASSDPSNDIGHRLLQGLSFEGQF